MSRIALLARIAPVLAAAVLTSAAGPARAQAYDPYGPRVPDAGPTPRDVSAVTPFIGVFDGTPRYALHPTPYARSDAGQSGLLEFNHQDYLPLDFGRGAPELVTDHGRYPVPFHYLVKYWETWPNAREREGQVPMLGDFSTAIRNHSQVTPPAAVKAVLDRQAETLTRAALDYPFVQRSEGVITYPILQYQSSTDPSGEQVWGFSLRIVMAYLGSSPSDPVQLPSGRWTANPTEGTGITICSNCYDHLYLPGGRYRGMQFNNIDRVLVDTIAAPLWISRYRGGQGEQINNPELFETGRPAGEIQLLTVTFPFDVGQGALAPDTARARALAIAWLTDWKALVNEVNGPNAPRAD